MKTVFNQQGFQTTTTIAPGTTDAPKRFDDKGFPIPVGASPAASPAASPPAKDLVAAAGASPVTTTASPVVVSTGGAPTMLKPGSLTWAACAAYAMFAGVLML